MSFFISHLSVISLNIKKWFIGIDQLILAFSFYIDSVYLYRQNTLRFLYHLSVIHLNMEKNLDI